MRADFGDVRFVDVDGVTVLSYWAQSIVASTSAVFWVKIPALPAATKTINMFWGNAGVTSASNGFGTFPFFDDFQSGAINASRWTTITPTTDSLVTVQNFGLFKLLRTANGGQGLVMDGTNIFFGKNNGAGVNGTIYEYDYTGAAIRNFAAPPHAAVGDIRDDVGDLIWGSGAGETPVMWQITKTGTQVATWNFTGVGYSRGAGPTYKTTNTILWVTTAAANPQDIQIAEIDISGGSGVFTVLNTWSVGGFGNPQGWKWKDGFLYYLSDNFPADGLGTLRQLQLNVGGTVTVVNSWTQFIGIEREGLTFDGTNWYYGTAELDIYKIIFNDGLAARLYAWAIINQNAGIYGPSTASPITMGVRGMMINNFPMMLAMGDTGGLIPAAADNMVGLGKLASGDSLFYYRNRKATVPSQAAYSGVGTTYQSPNNYEAKWNGTTVQYFQNGVSLGAALSTNIPVVALRPMLGGNTASNTQGFNSFAYWVYLRVYQATDPTVTVNFLLRRDLAPAANDNTPMWLDQVA